MTGSPPFSPKLSDAMDPSPSRFRIESTQQFERSLKKVSKSYKSNLAKAEFGRFITEILKSLIHNPYARDSTPEPLPAKSQLPQGWTLHKLRRKEGQGASGQIRLIYLINEPESVIKPLWIYTHEQYAKRPPDSDLLKVLRESLEDG